MFFFFDKNDKKIELKSKNLYFIYSNVCSETFESNISLGKPLLCLINYNLFFS